MPTLIRLIVILLVLVGLAYGGMFALVMLVKPNEKEVTIRIPARDLMPSPQRDPLVLREIDTSRPVEPSPPAATEPAAPTEPATQAEPAAAAPAGEGQPAPAEDGSIVTLAPGNE